VFPNAELTGCVFIIFRNTYRPNVLYSRISYRLTSLQQSRLSTVRSYAGFGCYHYCSCYRCRCMFRCSRLAYLISCRMLYFEVNFIGRPDRIGNRRPPIVRRDLRKNSQLRVRLRSTATNKKTVMKHGITASSVHYSAGIMLWKLIDALKKE